MWRRLFPAFMYRCATTRLGHQAVSGKCCVVLNAGGFCSQLTQPLKGRDYS